MCTNYIYLLNKIDQISIEVNVYKLHLPAQQDRPDLYRGKCVQTTLKSLCNGYQLDCAL